MRIANNLARLILVGAVLGALTVQGCGDEKSSQQSLQCADASAPGCHGAGGADGGLVTCAEICGKADTCCVAAIPVRQDGGAPCSWAPSCSGTSADDQLIAECRTFTALYPLNPACQ